MEDAQKQALQVVVDAMEVYFSEVDAAYDKLSATWAAEYRNGLRASCVEALFAERQAQHRRLKAVEYLFMLPNPGDSYQPALSDGGTGQEDAAQSKDKSK
jgi:hypothetical protein